MAVTEGVRVKEDRAYPAKPVARIAALARIWSMYKLVVMEFVLTDSSHSIGLSTGTSSRSLPCTYIFTDTKK